MAHLTMPQSRTRRAIIAAALASPLAATGMSAPAQGATPAAHDNEAIVRRAYHTAEGSVLDIAGFVGGFAEDGVINLGHTGLDPDAVGGQSYRGEQIGDIVLQLAELFPDIHRVLHRVNVLGDVVAIELSIQGTFLGPLETPAGIVQPTGAKVDAPGADFWYLRDGKIERFDCYIMFDTLYAQMGLEPDFASAVATPVAQ